MHYEAIERYKLAISSPINSGKRIESKNTWDYAFGFNVGQATGRNCEFLTIKSPCDLTTGQFHVPHTIAEGRSQRSQPLAPIKLHDPCPLGDILSSVQIAK